MSMVVLHGWMAVHLPLCFDRGDREPCRKALQEVDDHHERGGEAGLNVVLLSSIAPEAARDLASEHDVLDALDAGPEDLAALMSDREAIVLRSGVQVTGALLQAGPGLRLIVRAGSGVDNIDLATARARGIAVVRVPGPSAQAVAELTFALILAVTRKVALADRALRRGHWPKNQLGGHLLRGKTLGILGAGSIGSRVGELGAAWRMRVLGCVGTPGEARRRELAAHQITLADLDEVVAEADVLTVHTPLDATTRHLVDARILARMKPGSYLINMARGGVVDEAALAEALAGQHLTGAALDVHEQEGEGVHSPLAEFPNVVLTPHIGGMALESQSEIGRSIVLILRHFEADATIPDLDGVVTVA